MLSFLLSILFCLRSTSYIFARFFVLATFNWAFNRYQTQKDVGASRTCTGVLPEAASGTGNPINGAEDGETDGIDDNDLVSLV